MELAPCNGRPDGPFDAPRLHSYPAIYKSHAKRCIIAIFTHFICTTNPSTEAAGSPADAPSTFLFDVLGESSRSAISYLDLLSRSLAVPQLSDKD